jgi:hypothetical protein
MIGLEWAVAAAPLQADPLDSGDRFLVTPFPGGMLVGVADGLGHGPEAAAAARLAVDIVEGAAGESPIALLRRCHEGLRPTRGAVISVASFDHADRTMTWSGVGNVEGVLLRADPGAEPRREALLLRGGVVGHELPQLSALVVGIEDGDTLVFATDGIRPDFATELSPQVPSQPLADRILSRYRTGNDDALVLVARYRGNAS